ncbi:MAG: cyclic-di-AMP receptor, partial [Clostridia bacterium]|nr:cyclic-di-AMP receptor [Clostridia bacterium]
SHSRKQMIAPSAEPGLSFYPTMPIEVVVGGATIFILPVERFEKY